MSRRTFATDQYQYQDKDGDWLSISRSIAPDGPTVSDRSVFKRPSRTRPKFLGEGEWPVR
jgi:hypothetical protein